MNMKICESCGMPMNEAGDFGGGNTENAYCKYCTYSDGTLKPYEVKLEELARFIMDRSGATHESALGTARENLSQMPAWKDLST